MTDPTRDPLGGPPTGEVVEPRETSFEVVLDEPPEPGIHAPVYVDVVTRDHEVRPIIPASLRGVDNVKATAKRAAGRTTHRAGYHAVRSPMYGAKVALWAPWGAVLTVSRVLRWASATEHTWSLMQGAANRADGQEWRKLDNIRERHARWRWWVVVAGAVALIGVLAVLLSGYTPWWARWAALAAAVPYLAHAGRPVDRPIVTPAVVTARFRKLTADIVLRAYYAAGLGRPDKDDQRITFGSVMARDGEGSRVLVDLPYGKGLDDAIKAKGAIASGLDVSVSQVFISRDPTSHRRHVLWVADRDPLAIPAGRTPLLRCQQTDIWQPAPFGLDERGQAVTVGLMWNSMLVGAQPRQGKTFSARALALYAALDPYVRLDVFDGKGSPDWRKFGLVAHRCGFGLAMSRDGDPVDLFLEALREIKADVQDRYERLSQLPVDVCPDGKLTREIARDPRYRMPVRLVVIDEFQEYFDLGDASKEIAGLLVYLVKVAPAAGVIVLGATQRPSGVGSNQIAQQFISFRDNFLVRFSLRTGSWQVSDLVLGSGAYSEGYDSSTLLPTYKGVGIMRGASDVTPTVRTYLADGEDAEKILTAARAYRERAGTLSGYATGEDMARQARDVLNDVVRVWAYVGRPGVQWQQLAELLAREVPEAYAGTTAESISALVRAEGVPSEDVKVDGVNLKGCKRKNIDAAIERRAIGR